MQSTSLLACHIEPHRLLIVVQFVVKLSYICLVIYLLSHILYLLTSLEPHLPNSTPTSPPLPPSFSPIYFDTPVTFSMPLGRSFVRNPGDPPHSRRPRTRSLERRRQSSPPCPGPSLPNPPAECHRRNVSLPDAGWRETPQWHTRFEIGDCVAIDLSTFCGGRRFVRARPWRWRP